MRDVEFGGRIEAARGNGAGRRQHAITTHNVPDRPRGRSGDRSVRRKSIGIELIVVAQSETRFGGEDVVPEPLYRADVIGIGGQHEAVPGTGLGRCRPVGAMSTDEVLMPRTMATPSGEMGAERCCVGVQMATNRIGADRASRGQRA